jgi:hypothetical protein
MKKAKEEIKRKMEEEKRKKIEVDVEVVRLQK